MSRLVGAGRTMLLTRPIGDFGESGILRIRRHLWATSRRLHCLHLDLNMDFSPVDSCFAQMMYLRLARHLAGPRAIEHCPDLIEMLALADNDNGPN